MQGENHGIQRDLHAGASRPYRRRLRRRHWRRERGHRIDGQRQRQQRWGRSPSGEVTVENYEVKSGTTAVLEGTRVQGNLFVRRDATLIARRIQVKQGGGATVTGTRITGDLQYDEMTTRLVADDNVINGSVQVVKNFGGVSVNRNRIDGNLQCKECNPAPTGGGNIVQGNKEDQCERL